MRRCTGNSREINLFYSKRICRAKSGTNIMKASHVIQQNRDGKFFCFFKFIYRNAAELFELEFFHNYQSSPSMPKQVTLAGGQLSTRILSRLKCHAFNAFHLSCWDCSTNATILGLSLSPSLHTPSFISWFFCMLVTSTTSSIVILSSVVTSNRIITVLPLENNVTLLFSGSFMSDSSVPPIETNPLS